MEERTVVAWDGSGPADRAVAWALERVRDRGGRMVIVRVIDDAHLYIDELDVQRRLAFADFALAELAARLRTRDPDLDVATIATAGDPLDVLSAFSGERTLLVVGSEHGMTDDYWRSSRMGRRLAATVPGPVAIVPVEDDVPRSGVVAGIDIDGSAERIARTAAELAADLDQPLVLVHALDSDPGTALDVDSPDEEPLAVLDETAALVEAEFPDVVVERHVSHDSAIRTLLRRAATASHVVVGTRRPGTLRRLFLGSVSHAVVNNAKCPAIVVAPDRVVAGRGRS